MITGTLGWVIAPHLSALETADWLSLWVVWKQLGEDGAVVKKELACPHSRLSF